MNIVCILGFECVRTIWAGIDEIILKVFGLNVVEGMISLLEGTVAYQTFPFRSDLLKPTKNVFLAFSEVIWKF